MTQTVFNFANSFQHNAHEQRAVRQLKGVSRQEKEKSEAIVEDKQRDKVMPLPIHKLDQNLEMDLEEEHLSVADRRPFPKTYTAEHLKEHSPMMLAASISHQKFSRDNSERSLLEAVEPTTPMSLFLNNARSISNPQLSKL